jgi:hypothetical protein
VVPQAVQQWAAPAGAQSSAAVQELSLQPAEAQTVAQSSAAVVALQLAWRRILVVRGVELEEALPGEPAAARRLLSAA